MSHRNNLLAPATFKIFSAVTKLVRSDRPGVSTTADCYVVGIDLIVYQESQLPPCLAWPDLLSLSTAAEPVYCTVQVYSGHHYPGPCLAHQLISSPGPRRVRVTAQAQIRAAAMCRIRRDG